MYRFTYCSSSTSDSIPSDSSSSPLKNHHADCKEMTSNGLFRVRARNRKFGGLSEDEESVWKGPFTFVQAADTQFGMIFSFTNKDESLSEWDQEVALASKAIDAVNKMIPKPRFFVVCGDLVDAMPGVSHKKAQVLNSQFYLNDSQTKDLKLAQDEWLSDELNGPQNFKHLIGLQHVPPFVKEMDEDRVDVFGDQKLSFNFPHLAERKKFVDQLRKGGMKKLFCGHYHRNAGGFYQDFEVIVTSAIGCQLGSDASGLRIVKVTENSIQHKYYNLDEIPLSTPLDQPLP